MKDWSFGVDVAVEGLLEERFFIRVEILHSVPLLEFRGPQFGLHVGQFIAKGSP